ncbi:hypothetical protein ACLOJK_019956 [Asimina triloba]
MSKREREREERQWGDPSSADDRKETCGNQSNREEEGDDEKSRNSLIKKRRTPREKRREIEGRGERGGRPTCQSIECSDSLQQRQKGEIENFPPLKIKGSDVRVSKRTTKIGRTDGLECTAD